MSVVETFDGSPVVFQLQPELNLDMSLRQHQAADVHWFVASLLEETSAAALEPFAKRLEADGFHLRLTRSLDTAKDYLRERYAENRDARFGLVASSRDRDLQAFGVATVLSGLEIRAIDRNPPRLMLMLGRLIADRQLTQVEAARLLGVSRPRVSDVVRGRVERFTIDALVEMLARAGVRLDIIALPASA